MDPLWIPDGYAGPVRKREKQMEHIKIIRFPVTMLTAVTACREEIIDCGGL